MWDSDHSEVCTTRARRSVAKSGISIYMSKRMTAAAAQIDRTKLYSLDQALPLIKATSTVKFDASVEVHARLGINTKKTDQHIRMTLTLPHGVGKTKRVAAFVNPNSEKAAKDAGADFIFTDEDIKTIKDTGKVDFDVAIATPDMMPKLAMIARVLGPRGLMPNPKTDTVGTDVAKMVTELKKGKISCKNDDTANIHQVVGKVSFSEQQLKENIVAFLDALRRAKPNTAKGTYIKALYLTSAMGPSVKVDVTA